MTTQEQVKDVVSQVLADKVDKGGIKRVVWIGAGGSNGGNYPAQYFMEHEATQVVSSSYTSNEFVHATPAYVNENTLAVVVSMRGTKETIVAAQVAKDHGASTIAIYVDESGLTEVCDYKIQYDSLAVDESWHGPYQLRRRDHDRHGAHAADRGLCRVRDRYGRLRPG